MRTGLLRILLYVACVAAIVILAQFFVELRHDEDDQIRVEFDAWTAKFTQEVKNSVSIAMHNALSVSSFFESTNDITEIEFSRFILRSDFFTGPTSVRAIVAIPLLSKEKLPAFNAALKAREHERSKLGYVPFQIQEVEGRESYAPAVYVEPLAGRDGILGYDIATNPERMSTARSSLVLAQPHVTPPVVLSQDKGKSIPSIIIFTAVKSGGDMGLRPYKNETDDRTTFIGVSYSPSAAIESMMSPNPSDDHFTIHIADITGSEPITIYGFSQNRSEDTPAKSYQLVFGSRVWSLDFTSTRMANEHRDSNAYIF